MKLNKGGHRLLQRTHGGAIAAQSKGVYPEAAYNPKDLPDNLNTTVLTNSVTIADVLRKKETVSVILLGGEMSHRGHCHDYYTIQMVKNIRIDKAFLSHSALSVEFGASIHDRWLSWRCENARRLKDYADFIDNMKK